MAKKNHQFYNEYSPSPQVERRLNDLDDDIELKAPYRDILGVLESSEAWSPEDAIEARDIHEKIKEWEENHRERPVSIPTKRTVRIQLTDLENKGLVNSYQDKAKQYWKHPDSEIESRYWSQIVNKTESLGERLERFLCCNGIVLVGVIIYAIGGTLLLLGYFTQEIESIEAVSFTPVGPQTMITGLFVFIIGQIIRFVNFS